jgi:hypothetical protein
MCGLFKGAQGTQGIQGIQGFKGIQGTIGIQGLSGQNSDVNKMYVDSSLNQRDILIGAINASLNNTINGNSLYYTIADVPDFPDSSGNIGNIAYDSKYLYVCIETNTWARLSFNTW